MTIDDQQRSEVTGQGVNRAQGSRPQSTSRDLERYAGLFARRTQMMKSSAMRDLMAVTARPEVISLAGGLPDTASFPADTFATATATIAAESCARALQYGPTEGLDETKQCIAEVMQADGVRIDTDDVLVTTGGQQVIELVTKALIDPGDIVIAEAPTYPGAAPVFSSYEANVVQVEMDQDGLRVDLLEELLRELEHKQQKPKFIYTIPSFQNPAGVTLSLARRQRLVELAHRYELLILEDNPYSLLRYEGSPLPTLHSIDGGVYTMYLGTFSKILSPGIRLGWVVAPSPVLDKINIGKQGADICSSTLSQLLVHAYFTDNRWQDYVRSVSEIYRRRRDAMLDALAEHFPPEADWTRPQGGLFIWATLPEFIDTTDLLARALRDDVAFVPGAAAYLDGRGRNSMRLNFSGATEERLAEGIRRIGKVIKEQLALYGTLTGKPSRPTPQAQREDTAGTEPSPSRVVPLPKRRRSQRRAQSS